MRNRITFKGFRTWLNAQKNDREMPYNRCDTCPVAQYISKVFNAEEVDVTTTDYRRYRKNGAWVNVQVPKIFKTFIVTFDTNKVPTAAGAKKTLKQVMKENNIV